MKNHFTTFISPNQPQRQSALRLICFILLLLLFTVHTRAQNCSVNAGLDITTCNTTITLTGNVNGTVTSTPTWTFVSGPAGVTPVIVSPNSLITNITGMTIAGIYIFRISQPCPVGGTASQDVRVLNCAQNLATNITACSSAATLTANITGTVTSPPTWTYISGPAGATPVIVSPHSLSTVVSNLTITGTYTFHITQPFPSGVIASQDFTVHASAEPAGLSVTGGFVDCGTLGITHTLTASPLPAGWTGRWRVVDAVYGNDNTGAFTFSDITSPVTDVRTVASGSACGNNNYKFVWEITSPNGLCKYSRAVNGIIYPDINLFNVSTPPQTICAGSQVRYSAACGFWTLFIPAAYTVNLISAPPGFTGTIGAGNLPNGGVVVGGFTVPGQYEFKFTVTLGGGCGSKTFGPCVVNILPPPPPVPVVTAPLANLCIKTAPAAVHYSFTVADPTFITAFPLLGKPAGSDPLTITQTGAGTTNRTVTIAPNSHWKPGEYLFYLNAYTATDINKACPSGFYVRFFVYDSIPPVITTLPNTTVCVPTGATTASLTIPLPPANTAYLGNGGSWGVTKLSGPGGFDIGQTNFNNPVTQIWNLLPGVHTFQVAPVGIMAEEFACTGGYTPVRFTITVYNQPGANAGSNQNVLCIQQQELAGNLPIPPSIGTWSMVSGPSPMQFSNIHDPGASVSIWTNHANPGAYIFRWTISDPNGNCPAVSSEVTINAANRCNFLAVDFIAFSAVPKNGTSLLNWSTATEKNTSLFIAEWSADGINWQTAGEVPARGGTQRTDYSFTHLHPGPGVNYYRLRIVESDGKISYSSIASVRFDRTGSVEVLPNPVRDVLYVYNVKNGDRLVLVNAAGVTVRSAMATSVNTSINVSALTPGLYILQVVRNQAESVQQVKIIKQ